MTKEILKTNMKDETGKIIISETKNADTRSAEKLENLTEDGVKKDTEAHIEAVCRCGDWFCNLIKGQFKEHDHTKLGEYLPAFTEALKTGFKGKEFKDQDWWQIHLTERHHLNDRVPDDVNLVDVLEMVCDCVSAGLARTGDVYEVKIPDEVLQKAFKNTVKMLKDNIEVVSEKDEASKLFKMDLKED